MALQMTYSLTWTPEQKLQWLASLHGPTRWQHADRIPFTNPGSPVSVVPAGNLAASLMVQANSFHPPSCE